MPKSDIRFLPQTRFRSLQVAVALLAGLVFTLTAILSVQMLMTLNGWLGLLVFGLMLWGLGLWKLRSLARQIAVVALWFIVIVSILGTVNPFEAGEYLADGQQPPPVGVLLARIAPIVIIALLLLHLLGKYKGEFRKR